MYYSEQTGQLLFLDILKKIVSRKLFKHLVVIHTDNQLRHIMN